VTIVQDLSNNEFMPAIGATYIGFESRVLPDEAKQVAREDALEILRHAMPTDDRPQTTSLVVGQVQSGKTMSYEGLICLARDNHYPVVVVVSGVSNPLLAQGRGRLRADLSRAYKGAWLFLENPQLDDDKSQATLDSVFAEWADSGFPQNRRRTVVINVLKHHGRLKKLRELMTNLSLANWPILIIDDEADQASLNAKARASEESTTYSRILELRSVFDRFAYVQYTATPQAPLLVNIADSLSPDYVRVLTSGDKYIGGEAIFGPDASNFGRTISDSDLKTIEDDSIDPPNGLMHALRVYYLGLAHALSDASFEGNRSMLVHPSQGTAPHGRFANWVKLARDRWVDTFQGVDATSPDLEFLVSEFSDAHADLQGTVTTLPSMNELLDDLRFALHRSQVIEMNSVRGRTPEIDWEAFPGYILVGGQALDRGFTVEGLTVTYMPRGNGVGNADTIQQRARFFGYKRDYLAYCRVYVHPETETAFRHYMEHELDLHKQLREFAKGDKPLSQWRRAFLLSPELQPTRSSIRTAGYVRDVLSDDWFYDSRPAIDADTLRNQRSAFETLKAECNFEALGEESTPPGQRHSVARDVPLSRVLEVLASLRSVDLANSLRFTGLQLQLSALPEDVAIVERVDVYLMRPVGEWERATDENGSISELFQGESPATKNAKRGASYVGDRKILTDEKISLQLHELSLTYPSGQRVEDVPVMAIWVPKRLAKGWYVQGPG
jgi:hypothetical protein